MGVKQFNVGYGTLHDGNQVSFGGIACVSFDFFDTLVFRKSITHYQLWKTVSTRYFLTRLRAEVVARLIKRVKGIPEIQSEDLYSLLPSKWGLDFEIQLEAKSLTPNPVVIDLLKRAQREAAQVCIISDTHHREADIRGLLNHLGIPEVKIFTSGEFGLTKATGLFCKVQQILSVNYSNWIHIGDNLQSDVLSAKKLGIKPFYYPPIENQLVNSGLISRRGYKFLRKSKDLGNESISRMFVNLLSVIQHGNSATAATMPIVLGSVMGDLVSTAIAQEIHKMHKENDYDCIFYSSRDGWLPFLAHQSLFPKDPVQYFKTSRKMLQDPNFRNYLSSIIGDGEKFLMFDLGWRGSTARVISTSFPDKNWHHVYWQLLGTKTKNQIELNPGTTLNRLRIWRSRDFLETVFTDSSNGYDQLSIDLRPLEREESFGFEFKRTILEGAKRGIECHSDSSNLKMASLTLEAICRYPSKNLVKFAEGYSHQINEVTTGLLVITSWKDLLSRSRVLWPYGSKLYSGNKLSRIAFTAAVSLKELVQRGTNLIGRLRKTI